MFLKDNPRAQGVLMMLAAFGFFYMGALFRAPLVAEHKLLVATEKLDTEGNPFRRSVVLIVRHNAMGARGYIVNRLPQPPDNIADGGPVGQDTDSAVLALDGSGEAIGETGMVVTTDESIERSARKPSWVLKVKGYAGWAPKQLDKELRQRGWKVIPFDRGLITNHAGEDMWDAAQKVTPVDLSQLER
jgi:putative AlgH/UPF0301 family transcriptional regulator